MLGILKIILFLGEFVLLAIVSIQFAYHQIERLKNQEKQYRCWMCNSTINIMGVPKKKEIVITCPVCQKRIRVSEKSRIYPKGIFKKILSLAGKK